MSNHAPRPGEDVTDQARREADHARTIYELRRQVADLEAEVKRLNDEFKRAGLTKFSDDCRKNAGLPTIDDLITLADEAMTAADRRLELLRRWLEWSKGKSDPTLEKDARKEIEG